MPRTGMRPTRMVLRLEAERFTEDLAAEVKQTLIQHPGEVPVHLRLTGVGGEATTVRLGELYSVEPASDLIAKLKALLGIGSVGIEYPQL